MECPDREYYPFFVVVFLTVVALVIFWPVFDMAVIGGSLAVVLMPVHNRLSRSIRPSISAAAITIGLFVVFALVAYITLLILRANTGLINQIFVTIGSWLASPSTRPGAFGFTLNKDTLEVWLAKGDALFVNYWTTLADNLLLIAFKGIVLFLSFFLLLLKGTAIKERIFRHLPEPIKGYCDQLVPVTVDTLYVIYIVQFAIAALTFFIALPVFYLLGYGNIFFYSFLAAFCELIPILGSSVAFLIVGAYALALGDLRGLLIMIILGYVVVSALPEIYIRPVLVGRRVKINPVIMFVGLIGGLLTLGLAGFVLGPLIIVLVMKSYRIWTDERKAASDQVEPALPVDTIP
ncbi:AI-2E family transporter [Methanoregula sp.]|uniref:AI-2E family transporter n=1 Tax=Methanoregula sp. TaxID=2052170 RepID=UPI002B926F79|nr:AI-2E family transporter [Methanoregula sp.]HVP95794.1 AI-2E family transporter [Methanoregula sp.]